MPINQSILLAVLLKILRSPARVFTINSGNHTLAGVRDAVNAADIGIRASIVDTGDGFRLLFESEDTGKSNGFTIETQNANNGLDDFEFNETNFDNVLHATNAVDAELKVMAWRLPVNPIR